MFLIKTVAVATMFFTALAGISVAQENMPRKGVPAKPQATDKTLGMGIFSAVVEGDGTLVRGAGVLQVVKDGTGSFIVRFVRNVRNCTYVGSQGLTGNTSVQADGTVTVVGSFDFEDGVYTKTYNTAGGSSDQPFHLIVFCHR